jgi:hypothetical protein
MATCKDFYETARAWADSSTGYNNGFGYQCIGLIDGLNKAIGAGLTTYVRDDCAKNMYYDYASGAYSTPGWHTVAGDSHNDAHAKEIWNSLPNGAIVFWETKLVYGHVAIKIADWGSPNGDVVQQDGSTPTVPAHYKNIGAITEAGYMGFIGAIVSENDGWGGQTQGSGSTTTPNEPQSQSSAKDNIVSLLNNLLSNIKDTFNTNAYKASELYYINNVIKLVKNMNMYHLELNEESLKNIINTLKEALLENISKSNPNQNTNVPTSNTDNITGNEGSEDEKVKLITEICKKYCPEANAYGIAGMLGNFAHESGIDPTNFESKSYWDGKTEGATWQEEPTIENVFGSWSAFRGLYGIGLNEGAYLSNGKHFMGLGLGQWTGPRAKALVDWCKANGQQWWTCKGQMEFAFNGDGSNINILKACLTNSESVDEGVQNFYKYWERANVGSTVAHRNSEAQRLYPKVQQYL